ncbi:MAG: hypothetical protein ACYCW6_23105 [Candidatus Xenobia bacterium]
MRKVCFLLMLVMLSAALLADEAYLPAGDVVVNGATVPNVQCLRQGNVYLLPVDVVAVLAAALQAQAEVQTDAKQIVWNQKSYPVEFVTVKDHPYLKFSDLRPMIPGVAFGVGRTKVVFDTRPQPAAASGSVRTATTTVSPLASRILQFARAHMYQRVGDGECTTLVDAALKAAGAKGLGDFGSYGPDSNYVWGTPVKLEDVQPGDVIQFRDYQSEIHVENSGGRHSKTASAPHHTAIVVSNDGGGRLTVIHQNASPGGGVETEQLSFGSGTFDVGGDHITVKTTGQVWFYRPQPR